MRVAALVSILALQLGCAQYMAMKQAGPLDRKNVQVGADRTRIAGALGAPTVSDDGQPDLLVDTYVYKDGGKRNQPAVKAGRVVLYTAGDIFFLFLTQLVWMPAELLLDGTDYTAKVEYERGQGGDWVAARITETKMEGEAEVTVLERPGFAEERAAAAAAAGAAAAAALAAAQVHEGGCFAVAPDGQLITANHLLGAAETVTVDLADGRSFDARIERRAAAADAALLRIDAPTPAHVTLAGSTALAVGQPLFTVGHAGPADEPVTLDEGPVVELAGPGGDASFVRVNLPADSAIAGAPLLDERGEVVALVTAPGAAPVEPASTVSAGPPGALAIRAVYLAPLLVDPKPLPPAASREEAIARARAAVCRVHETASVEAKLDAEAVPDAAPAAEPVPTPVPDAETSVTSDAGVAAP